MNTTAGLWIDHRKAVIAMVSSHSEETSEIRSNVDKHRGRQDGVATQDPCEAQLKSADDSHQREFTGHLDPFYDRVVDAVCDAGTVLIFGPGEAKGEFRKRLDRSRFKGNILAVETDDKMTDRQIVAKVREHSET
jgi:hypothetical protein